MGTLAPGPHADNLGRDHVGHDADGDHHVGHLHVGRHHVVDGVAPGSDVVSTEDLDTAIAAVKAASAALRTAPSADVGPAEVSAVIGALRELVWNVTALTGTVAARYETIGALRHDHGDDPAVAVEMIGLRLGDARGWLVQVDESLGATHDHAARLARP